MNTVFGGYTGAGYMYGGSDSEHTSENSNNFDGGNMSDGEKYGSNGDISETISSNDGGTMNEGSEFSDGGTNVASIDTSKLKGGAIQNKKDFNQSWFIEKHRQPNKSKSRDYNKYEELVEIIYEALKSHN
uniref:Uncharacterized protein n=1 Tax=viral metagenome TaxID=1070528 RepID=A0A6C0BDQ3_9ZZZZ